MSIINQLLRVLYNSSEFQYILKVSSSYLIVDVSRSDSRTVAKPTCESGR